MNWTGWVAVALGFILGAWLAWDGMRAMVVGDYTTPSSGPHAGQLGPWAQLVRLVGLDPRSTLVKSAHVSIGAAWWIIAVCFAARLPWAWWGMVGCAVASLWYLPVGTLIGAVVSILLTLSGTCNMTADGFRKLALSLPEAIESAHMGHPDFRVGRRIFATLGYPDQKWAMVKLTPQQQAEFVQAEPKMFVPVNGGWGRRGATNVLLRAGRKPAVLSALVAAWRNIAPKRLAEAYDGG